MKKTTLLLTILLVLSLFVGCRDSPANNKTEDTTAPIATSPNSGEEISDPITVSGNKYTFEEKDVLILKAANVSSTTCNVALKVTYLDEQGNEIKNETKKFTGFAAGWENSFLFTPQITFHDYKCEVETWDFSGETLANKIVFENLGIEESDKVTDENRNPANGIRLFAHFTQSSNSNIKITFDIIVIGSNNEVYKIFSNDEYAIDTNPDMGYMQQTLYYTYEDTVVWPEELKGDVTVVFSLKEIVG